MSKAPSATDSGPNQTTPVQKWLIRILLALNVVLIVGMVVVRIRHG
jgi:uncharacterized protein YpmS